VTRRKVRCRFVEPARSFVNSSLLSLKDFEEALDLSRWQSALAFCSADFQSDASDRFRLLKDRGRVTATLTATDFPRGGIRWIQMDNNFSLDNLLVALFREFHERFDN